METEQYAIMAQAEELHWWYRGLRDLLKQSLLQPDLRLPARPSVLDAGCGTGANLKFLWELLSPNYLGGFDISEQARTCAMVKCPQAEVYESDIRDPDLHRGTYDLILSCDVIYTSGIDATLPGLRKLVHRLAPGGLCILNLPAYQWLLSSHDRAVHTSERYVLKQIRLLLRELGLECVRASYRLCWLLPLVVIKRMPSILRLRTHNQPTDLQQPPVWCNQLLLRVMQRENRLIAAGSYMRWGSSVFVIGRKPNVVSNVLGLR